jgi:SAM-dependent methyltransferase
MTVKPHEELRADEWAGEIGNRWLANLDRFESMNASIGRELLTRAAYRSGESVLDIGCGGGETTRTIARTVAPGRVLGLDISSALVTEAQRRAREAGQSNVSFVAGDAATVRLPGPPFDRLFSRFGIMFFPEPAAAFANLARQLRPGGRADFVVWAPPPRNPWMFEVVAILRQHLDLPQPVPHAPGPFALADPDYVTSLLEPAGFTNLVIEPCDDVVQVGGAGSDPDSAAAFVLGTMTFADAIRELPPQPQQAVVAGVTALFGRHMTSHGVVMPARTLMIRGTRGADA